MKASVSYTEISNWVSKRFRVAPTFRRVDEKTVEVSYKPGSFIPTIRMTFKIEAMRKDVICMSYNCSLPVSLLIAGAAGHLASKIPNGIEVKTDEKRINIYPQRIDKLQKVLEHVAPTDISFSEEEIILTLLLL